MSAEVSFDSNIIQLILIVGIILLIGGYFYYENIKIKNQLLEFEYKINKLSESLNIENQYVDMNEIPIEENQYIPQENAVLRENEPLESNEPVESNESIESDEWKNINDQMREEVQPEPLIYINEGVEVTDNIDLNKDNIDLNKDNKESLQNDNLLKSFTIDDMLKDIENENPKDDSKEDLDYTKMTVSQLKNILIEKNLPVSGNKTKLIQRILDNSE